MLSFTASTGRQDLLHKIPVGNIFGVLVDPQECQLTRNHEAGSEHFIASGLVKTNKETAATGVVQMLSQDKKVPRGLLGRLHPLPCLRLTNSRWSHTATNNYSSFIYSFIPYLNAMFHLTASTA